MRDSFSDKTRIELYELFKELRDLLEQTTEVIEGIAFTFYNSDEQEDENEDGSEETDIL